MAEGEDIGNLFATPSLSRASTREDLRDPGDDQVYEDVVDGAAGGAGLERPGAAQFERQQDYAARQLGSSRLGALLLPILQTLFTMAAQVGSVRTPDIDHMAELVNKVDEAIASGQDLNRQDDTDMLNRMIKAMYIGPVDPPAAVPAPDPKRWAKTDFLDPSKPARWSSALKAFPTNGFFSGTSDDRLNVDEFLSIMTDGVRRMKGQLSESDFKDILKGKTTGKAYQCLSMWLRNPQTSIASIYSKLLRTFDVREQPDEARQKLEAMSSTWYGNLHLMILRIEHLARRAALIVRGAAEQKVLFDVFGITALTRLIPEPYRAQAQAEKTRMEVGMAKSIAFDDFRAIVEKWTCEIDRILRSERVQKRPRPSGKVNEASAPSGGNESKNGARPKGRPQVNAATADPVVKPKWDNSKASQGPSGAGAYTTPDRSGVCAKCHGHHSSSACEIVGGPVGKYPCRKCDTGLFHFDRFCPFVLSEEKVKSQKQESPKGGAAA